MIIGVKVEVNPDNSTDSRRLIAVAYNSGPNDLPVAGQVKAILVNQEGGAWLGGTSGHYHDYMETYTVVTGNAVFFLQNVDKPEERQVADLKPEQTLTIPGLVAHKVYVKQGTVLIGITEQPYRGPEQDIPFAVQTDDEDRDTD